MENAVDEPAERPEERPEKLSSVSARATTPEDEVRAFFTLFERVERTLHMYLSDEDRARIRASLVPPHRPPVSDVHRLVTSDPHLVGGIVAGAIVLAVVYSCMSQSTSSPQAPMPYRSTGGERSSVASELMSWNIGRLLAPLTRSR